MLTLAEKSRETSIPASLSVPVPQESPEVTCEEGTSTRGTMVPAQGGSARSQVQRPLQAVTVASSSSSRKLVSVWLSTGISKCSTPSGP